MDDPFKNYPGTYYDPRNPANLKDLQNRQLFLRLAAEHVPGFVVSLFEAAVPVIGDWMKRNGSVPHGGSPGSREYYTLLYGAIRRWARRYNIEVDWMISEAHSAVFIGLLYAQKGIDPALAFGTWRSKLRVRKAYRDFRLPAWDSEAESPQAYIDRADQEWRRVRDEYIESTRAELAAAGLKQIPIPRKRRLTNEARFTWAVLHQCSGKSVDEVADEYREDTETVRISVARVLKELGFTPPT